VQTIDDPSHEGFFYGEFYEKGGNSMPELENRPGNGQIFIGEEITTHVLVTPLIEGVAVPIRRGTGVARSSSELSMFKNNPRKIAQWEAERRVTYKNLGKRV
jgi:hypothetical protein